MQTRKHWVALGLLSGMGVFVVTSMKTPVDHGRMAFPPPVERHDVGVVASFVVSASDACVKANAPDPMAMETAALQAVRNACERAAEEQARALNWKVEDTLEPQENGADVPMAARRSPLGTPRVARRTSSGTTEESQAGRSRN